MNAENTKTISNQTRRNNPIPNRRKMAFIECNRQFGAFVTERKSDQFGNEVSSMTIRLGNNVGRFRLIHYPRRNEIYTFCVRVEQDFEFPEMKVSLKKGMRINGYFRYPRKDQAEATFSFFQHNLTYADGKRTSTSFTRDGEFSMDIKNPVLENEDEDLFIAFMTTVFLNKPGAWHISEKPKEEEE